MIDPQTALRRILSGLSELGPLPPERVPFAEALGRALAEDLTAERALPPFDNAQMDGYALRAADARRAGARLPVAFVSAAGAGDLPPLPPGACARIYTGAPLPAGADAVEMQEEVAREGDVARFRRPAVAGRFVRRAGHDVRPGTAPLQAGALVDPGAVGLAAALGRGELLVHRRPRVAILATGDELVPVHRSPGPGQIADSNSHMIAAAAREAGAETFLLPLARDSRPAIRRALQAARGADLLVTTGGVSVGDRDLTREVLESMGTRLAFWKVAMRPGKPVAFGRWNRTGVFGLPGNPVSALVTFELFVRPAIRLLAGLRGPSRPVLPGRMGVAFEKDPRLTYFVRARARLSEGRLWVDPLPTQSSGALTSATGFDALAVLPPGRSRLARGGRIAVVLLGPPREE